MRIGEIAQQAGVTVHTLRFYERKGLLPRAPRGPANYRDYPRTAVQRLKFIRDAQGLGFTLSEVRELIGPKGPAECAALRSVGERKLREVESELHRLRRIRTSLRKLLRGCAAPAAAPACHVALVVRHVTSA